MKPSIVPLRWVMPLILVLLVPAWRVAAQLPPELRDNLTHATVYIETQLALSSRDWASLPKEAQDSIGQRPGGPASGSGFLISPDGYVITNAHVIEGITYVMQWDEKNLKIVSVGGGGRSQPFNAERPTDPFTFQFTAASVKVVVDSGLETEEEYSPSVVRIDKDLDLALLKISGTEDFKFLDIAAEEEVETGTRAIMAGFPGGATPDVLPFLKASNAAALADKNPRISLNLGTVSSVREHEKERRYQLAIGANHGNSGGPITNADGAVIAVLYAGIDRMQSLNYAIPSAYITKICPSDLREQLGLPDRIPWEDESADEGEDGGDEDQSFDDFVGEGTFDFGEKKK